MTEQIPLHQGERVMKIVSQFYVFYNRFMLFYSRKT